MLRTFRPEPLTKRPTTTWFLLVRGFLFKDHLTPEQNNVIMDYEREICSQK